MPLRPSAKSALRRGFMSWPTLRLLAAVSAAALPSVICNPVYARSLSNEPIVVVGGQTAKLKQPPFVSDNGQLYAPVDFVGLMGIDYTVQASQQTVSLSKGLRHAVWPCVMIDGTAMVQVAGIAQDFGADYQWDQGSQTGTVRAKILMVRENDDRLTVDTSFPVSYRVAGIAGPNRVYVDVYNAALNGPYTTIPTDGDDDVSEVRANQMNGDKVRVTVDLRRPLAYETANAESGDEINIRLTDRGSENGGDLYPSQSAKIVPASLTNTPDQPSTNGGDAAAGGSPAQAPLNPAGIGWDLRRAAASKHISSITTDESHPGVFLMSVTVAGDLSGVDPGYRAFLLSSPSRLAIDFPGTDFTLSGDLASNTACQMPLTTAAAKTLRWGIVKSSSTLLSRVVLDLYKPLSYSVATTRQPDGSTIYTLSALLNTTPPDAPLLSPPDAPTLPIGFGAPTSNPASADNNAPQAVTPPPVVSNPAPGSSHNSLAGLTIVVDPGHGGYDTGAPGIHGVFEKNIVLSIGKDLRDELTAAGAKVLMTRDDDTFIPLLGRSAIANDNNADLFVSVHADSAPRSGATGTSVYYHANVLPCRDIANSVSSRLAQLEDGIPSKGIISDFVRYPGIGFSVLRHSKITAILVETGYVNSDNDEPVLTDPADQKLIAEGIAAGIKDYFGNRGSGVADQGEPRSRSIMTKR